MAIHLGRPLPNASCDRPGRRLGNAPAGRSPRVAPTWSCSRWGLPCRSGCPERGALLPHPFTLAGGPCGAPVVCSLWHFPWGRPRRVLPGTVFPWSPDFPPPELIENAGGSHPTVWQRKCGLLLVIGQAVFVQLSINEAVSQSKSPSIFLGRK